MLTENKMGQTVQIYRISPIRLTQFFARMLYLYLWKRVLGFWPDHLVCLSVCVCACMCVCLSIITFVVRLLHSATWCQVYQSGWYGSSGLVNLTPWIIRIIMDHPTNMDHPDHILFWPITLKVLDGFTPNFTFTQCCSGHTMNVAHSEIHR